MDTETIKTSAENATGGDVDNSVDTVDYELLYNGLTQTVKELQAERDSLKAENDTLRKQSTELTADAAKVREMNYTLSRQLDLTQGVKKSPEELFFDAFLKKGD